MFQSAVGPKESDRGFQVNRDLQIMPYYMIYATSRTPRPHAKRSLNATAEAHLDLPNATKKEVSYAVYPSSSHRYGNARNERGEHA